MKDNLENNSMMVILELIIPIVIWCYVNAIGTNRRCHQYMQDVTTTQNWMYSNVSHWLPMIFIISTRYFMNIRIENRKIINFLIKHMTIAPVKRRRVSSQDAITSLSKCFLSYCVQTQKKTMIRVCLNTFINILHISRFRLNNLSKQYFDNSAVTRSSW